MYYLLFISQSLTRRRGSAPVSLPLVHSGDNLLPAGGTVRSPDLRRGSVPVEIAHRKLHYSYLFLTTLWITTKYFDLCNKQCKLETLKFQQNFEDLM